MNKKIEDVFDLPPIESQTNSSYPTDQQEEMGLDFDKMQQQLDVADKIGFGVAWVAQAHLSTQIQKTNKKPVIPHWQGEVGLCTDFFQLAHQMFSRTKNIEVGSAVMSIFCNGGP